MLYSYNNCFEIYGSDKKIKQAIVDKKIYKIEKGIYSDKEFVSEISIISKKYPKAIFTLNSAFYYHGLTDVIPKYYYLATSKQVKGIMDKRVKQKFENSTGLNLGVITMEYNKNAISIYDKERMLVELIRNKNKLPFDYYKEIINNYRKIIDDLDIQLIQEYIYALPKTNMIMETLNLEVL